MGLLVAAFNQSCTNLDEELYSEVTPDNFFKSEAEFVSALGAAYTLLEAMPWVMYTTFRKPPQTK